MNKTDFYAGQKVIVTGGAGFVGSHLVKALLSRGADIIIVVDDFSRGKSRMAGVRYRLLDAGDRERLTTFLANEKPFAIFNLAARVAGVTYNQTHQLEMFKANIDLQTAPVMAAETAGIPHFLQVSSVCVYGSDANAPAVEDNIGSEPTAANDGYSWAKRFGERAVQWSELKHAVIVRPSNIYGPRDYYDPDTAHVIPALITKVLSDSPEIEIFGTGKEMREFIRVEDVATGMLHALEFGQHKEAYNLGTNGETTTTIKALLQAIQRAAGTNKPVQFSSEYDPGDNKRWSDCSKMMKLGWRYTWGLHQGVPNLVSSAIGRERVRAE